MPSPTSTPSASASASASLVSLLCHDIFLFACPYPGRVRALNLPPSKRFYIEDSSKESRVTQIQLATVSRMPEGPLGAKWYRVCSKINCINHRESSHLLQLSPNWQPMAPTIATKTKAKAKIISAVLFFISVGFRAPDSSSSVGGQMKNFSQP